MDELTYDKRFELRSWLLQWAVLSSHAAIGRIAFMHEQDTWIASSRLQYCGAHFTKWRDTYGSMTSEREQSVACTKYA
ncbi:hypothetical protein D917_10303 [Trichinella nativa]|uniref:Uncharacterized protein n=1 Tax=Trichinella nativa TaxID=6335 RepID=A0A1Y3EDC5_9BILA|nr:hypothetical protein D917_10303 [Trichinella nativa]